MKDNWLSEFIGKDTFKINVDDTLINQKDNFFKGQLEKLQGSRIFIYSKVPTDRLSHVHYLEKSGFKLIDTNIKLNRFSDVHQNVKFSDNCSIRLTEPGDKEKVAKLAENNFRFSRFHLDPEIDNNIANLVKCNWVENYYNGKRDDKMVVACVSKKVAGFLLLIKKDKILTIDLIAVDARHQRRKIASDMINYTILNFDFSELQVGTQVGNIPSIRLYEKLGFRMIGSEYVFHFHQ